MCLFILVAKNLNVERTSVRYQYPHCVQEESDSKGRKNMCNVTVMLLMKLGFFCCFVLVLILVPFLWTVGFS